MNTYGFAEGDPVRFSDPYGLSADTSFVGPDADYLRKEWIRVHDAANAAAQSSDPQMAAAGRKVATAMRDIEDATDWTLVIGSAVEGSGGKWAIRTTAVSDTRSTMIFNMHPSAPGYYMGAGENTRTMATMHDVGHAWTNYIFRGNESLRRQFTDVNAIGFENAGRRITGCGGYVKGHNVEKNPCP